MGLPTFLDRKVASPKGLAISLVKSGQSDWTGHFVDGRVASPFGLATYLYLKMASPMGLAISLVIKWSVQLDWPLL